jgi:hypothetical protein
LLVVLSRGAIRDIDVWWHREIGEELWERRTITGLGNDWAPFGDQGWVTTQWLSELGFYAAHVLGGWEAFPPIRVLASLAVLVALAAAVLPRRPARAAVPVFVLAALGLMPALTQDRVQTVALLLAVPLGVWLERGVRGQVPPWWHVGLLSMLWANLHGSWVLVPALLALLAAASAIDVELRSRWRAPAQLALVALAAGMLNPAGWQSLTAVWRFRERTAHVVEWDPTIIADVTVLPFVLLLAVLVAAWARSSTIPWPEVIVALGVSAFGMLAFRNVLFALVLLAPLAAQRLSVFTRPRVARGTEASALVAVSVGSVVACLVVALALAFRTDALSDAAPLRIAAYLAEVEGPKRILNDYNTAGVLVAFGGDDIELGIDGRADRYPAEYTDHYLGAQAQLIRWQEMVDQVDPDFAVLDRGNALPTHLEALGWRTLLRDGRYVLMAPR